VPATTCTQRAPYAASNVACLVAQVFDQRIACLLHMLSPCLRIFIIAGRRQGRMVPHGWHGTLWSRYSVRMSATATPAATAIQARHRYRHEILGLALNIR
jgi:hypothetical protein